MADLQFLTLGIGNAFSARYYSSSLALCAEDQWLLVDCPHPIRKMVHEAAKSANITLDLPALSAVILTHLHADHSSGLEGFGFFWRYAMSGKKPSLIAHPQVLRDVWTGHLAGGMEWSMSNPGEPIHQRSLEDFFEVKALSETGMINFGPFQIECRKTIHNIPTTALRICVGKICLGYSADTAFDPQLIQWLSKADLIIHETGEGGLHSPYANLEKLPTELRKKMRLIHYGDDFDIHKSSIEPLVQGRLYSVANIGETA